MTVPMRHSMYWDEDVREFYCGDCGAACQPTADTQLPTWACGGPTTHVELTPLARSIPISTMQRLNCWAPDPIGRRLTAEWRKSKEKFQP